MQWLQVPLRDLINNYKGRSSCGMWCGTPIQPQQPTSDGYTETVVPKRIWIINQFANTPDVPGHTRQYEYGQHLAKLGYEVTVFASDYNLTERRYRRLRFPMVWSSECLELLRWRWLFASPYQHNNWRRHLNLLTFNVSLLVQMLILPRPDLVIGSSPQLPATWLAMRAAKLRGARFIFEVRDLWPQVLIDLGGCAPNSKMVRFLRKLESSLYCNSDCVIVLAKGSIEYVRQRGTRSICHLPNGPDLNSITADLCQEQAKDKFSVDRSRFCLMYTGAHGEANALDGLINAARLLEREYPNRFQILLVGDGPEKQKLQSLAHDVACVEFRAPVPKRDIPDLLAAADGLILTLRDIPLFKYSVSPNKLYDYYAAMRPVIVSVGGAVNDEVETLSLGFTAEPESPRQLADAIIKLSLLPSNEREAMGARALQLVQRVYSRQAVLHTLTKIVGDLS